MFTIPQFNPRPFVTVSHCIVILIGLCLPAATQAQKDTPGASKILVGTVEASPFATKTKNGEWEGLSIELWRSIARDLGVDYEFIAYDDLGRLKVDLEKGALDLSIAMAVTAAHEADFDLSHPFLTSGSAIAIPAAQTHHSLIHFSGRVADRFVSLSVWPCPRAVPCVNRSTGPY